VGTVFQQENGATRVVEDFYTRVQKQDHTGAYTDLQLASETAGDFTQKPGSRSTMWHVAIV
jgi:hypothetical protein